MKVIVKSAYIKKLSFISYSEWSETSRCFITIVQLCFEYAIRKECNSMEHIDSFFMITVLI